MVEIRPLTHEDWPAVERIYAEGIATAQATFETETPTWAEFDASMLPGLRFVAVENAASVALHERAGFRVVGRRERIAKLDGERRDTLLLERRAPTVG